MSRIRHLVLLPAVVVGAASATAAQEPARPEDGAAPPREAGPDPATADSTGDGRRLIPFPVLFYAPETGPGFGAAALWYFRADGRRPSYLAPLLVYRPAGWSRGTSPRMLWTRAAPGPGAPCRPRSERPRALSRRWKIALAGLLLIVAAAPAAFVAFRPVTVIPRLSLAPGFALVDQGGGRLTSDDLKGSVTLYGFTYGSCGPACPDVIGTMRSVADRLEESDLGIPVRLVTISFDPERDTPDRLAERAAALAADTAVWSLATAPDTAAARAVVGTGFEVWYERAPDGGFRHDPVLVLVDGLGVRRVEYRTGLPDPDRVLAQMRELSVEARAEGAMRFAYEAAHFLSCYSN